MSCFSARIPAIYPQAGPLFRTEADVGILARCDILWQRGDIVLAMSLGGTVPEADDNQDIPEYVDRPEDIHRANELFYGSPAYKDKPIEEVTTPISSTGPRRIENRELDWRHEAQADQIHEARSEKAQSADESFNAPIAPTLGHWVRDPNRWDLPGVDTIAPEVGRKRAESFLTNLQDYGIVETVTEKESIESQSATRTALGLFRVADREVLLRKDLERWYNRISGFTAAHEAGHAIDYVEMQRQRLKQPKYFDLPEGIDFLPEDQERIDTLFQDSEETIDEQLDRLTVRARGAYVGNDPDEEFADIRADEDEEYSEYRSGLDEKMADAFALAVLEPRATKREAPELFEFLQEKIPEPRPWSPWTHPPR